MFIRNVRAMNGSYKLDLPKPITKIDDLVRKQLTKFLLQTNETSEQKCDIEDYSFSSKFSIQHVINPDNKKTEKCVLFCFDIKKNEKQVNFENLVPIHYLEQLEKDNDNLIFSTCACVEQNKCMPYIEPNNLNALYEKKIFTKEECKTMKLNGPEKLLTEAYKVVNETYSYSPKIPKEEASIESQTKEQQRQQESPAIENIKADNIKVSSVLGRNLKTQDDVLETPIENDKYTKLVMSRHNTRKPPRSL